MSHITRCPIEVTNLVDARAAAERLGGTLHEGQTRFTAYYGTNPCAHAISFPGAKYQAGLIEQGDGTFRLQYDSWRTGGLGTRLGKSGEKFAQAYGIEAATRAARLKGYAVQEKTSDEGHVHVQLTVA